MVKDLLAWTGWSQRHLATILGTSHPTVKRLQEEGSSERSAAVAERLPHIHPVVRRLWLSLDHNPRRVREVLSTPPLPGELSPEQLLKQGKYARAYRIALAIVQGIGNEGLFKPPPGASMLEGTHAPY
jgi:hypothetical protein